MADAPCSCLQCQIRRAAFGPDQDVSLADFEKGILALACLFGCVIAQAPTAVGVKAMQAFVGGQIQTKAALSAGGDISTMEVAGHG